MQSGINITKSRLPELDGLRGLAISLVLIWHYFVVTSPIFSSNPIGSVTYYFRITWSGVDLFFVLSGFLIGRILLEAKNSDHYFKPFYVRRLCRIVPLYYLVIAIFYLGVFLSNYVPFLAETHLFSNRISSWVYPLFLQNIWMARSSKWGAQYFSVAWSLAVEEQFYLILPFLVRFLSRRVLPLVLLALVITAPVSRALLFDNPDHGGLMGYVLVFCRFDSLGLGALAAWISTVPAVWRAILDSWRLINLIFLIALGGALYFTIKGSCVATSAPMSYYGYTWLAVLYLCMLLLALAHPEGLVGKFCRLASLRYLGTISYGIYLLHEPINYALHTFFFNSEPSFHDLNSGLVTLLALAGTIVISDVSWHYFESKMVKFGHRYKYDK